MEKLILIVSLLCCIAAASIDPASLNVWLVPSIASADYTTMFQNPDEWSTSRSKIDTFGFNTMNVDGSTGWAPNDLAGFTAVNAFSQLSQWGIPITVGPSVIMEGDCYATNMIIYMHSVYRGVFEEGGQVLVLDMDEPLYGGIGTNCGFNPQQTAQITANWMKNISSTIPGSVIGDTEPYPSLSPSEMTEFISLMSQAGQPLAWFHLDINWQFMYDQWHNGAINPTTDLQSIQSFCQQQGIPFGIIIDDLTAQTDVQYYNLTMTNFQFLQGIFGDDLPGIQLLFMSWNYAPPTPNYNVPETTYSTMTNLMLNILDIVESNRARKNVK